MLLKVRGFLLSCWIIEMENLYPDGGKEQNELPGSTISELKTELVKISSNLPLLLEFNQESNSQRCYCKSCPCGKKLDFPNYLSSVSPDKNFEGHCIGSENKASNSPSVLYKKTSLYRSSGFSFGSQKNRRSTSIDVVISPSERWIFDSVDSNLNSLVFEFGFLNGKRSKQSSASVDTRKIKSSEMCSSPSNLGKSFGHRNSEVSLSTTSTSSSLSPSSENSFSKGFLYCMWKSGVPCFVFSLENHGGEVYLANVQKVESRFDKSLDYVYSFRSMNSNAADVVGKMKVSSSVVPNSSGFKLMENEFVLFGSLEDFSKEMQISSSALTKSKGLLKKMTEIFRYNHAFNHKTIQKICETMPEIVSSQYRDLDELDNVKLFAQGFQPNLELASIVVKDYQQKQQKCNREASPGGWGLKFLENVQDGESESSQKGSRIKSSVHPTREISVVIPAGFHAGPFKRTGGPSSLIERWKANGGCDCGGWDVGCPLTVMKNDPVESLLRDGSENLFVEGKENEEPTLRFMNKSKDLYVVLFHSSLSALQSFSIAVAIVHTQTAHFYPEM